MTEKKDNNKRSLLKTGCHLFFFGSFLSQSLESFLLPHMIPQTTCTIHTISLRREKKSIRKVYLFSLSLWKMHAKLKMVKKKKKKQPQNN